MIQQAILNGVAYGHSGSLYNFRPVDADPADWAEQQRAVPLPEDEYPHAGGDRRSW